MYDFELLTDCEHIVNNTSCEPDDDDDDMNGHCEPDDYTSVNCDPDVYGDYACDPDYDACNPD
jgi:hypothetical protein